MNERKPNDKEKDEEFNKDMEITHIEVLKNHIVRLKKELQEAETKLQGLLNK